jgi:hypothetical protein
MIISLLRFPRANFVSSQEDFRHFFGFSWIRIHNVKSGRNPDPHPQNVVDLKSFFCEQRRHSYETSECGLCKYENKSQNKKGTWSSECYHKRSTFTQKLLRFFLKNSKNYTSLMLFELGLMLLSFAALKLYIFVLCFLFFVCKVQVHCFKQLKTVFAAL